MSYKIAIVTDDTERSRDVAIAGADSSDAHLVDIGSDAAPELDSFNSVIIDVPLTSQKSVAAVRRILAGISPTLLKVFVADTVSRRDYVQANFLGAQDVVSRDLIVGEFDTVVGKRIRAAEVASTAEKIEAAYENVFDAVQRGEPLPAEPLNASADQISQALEGNNIETWLDELKKHHSYTHRHSMHVTGFSIAFGLHYRMRQADVHRLAIGALMHDVGKAKIPLDILDKPATLTQHEKEIIARHPVYSCEILEEDGQFDDEVIDVARHHHENLDGSGYPDGLVGDQISDLVRIVTVADVFSALVDKRSYKDSLPRNIAFSVMCDMDGKLDMDIVRAFEPIALGADSKAFPSKLEH